MYSVFQKKPNCYIIFAGNYYGRRSDRSYINRPCRFLLNFSWVLLDQPTLVFPYCLPFRICLFLYLLLCNGKQHSTDFTNSASVLDNVKYIIKFNGETDIPSGFRLALRSWCLTNSHLYSSYHALAWFCGWGIIGFLKTRCSRSTIVLCLNFLLISELHVVMCSIGLFSALMRDLCRLL